MKIHSIYYHNPKPLLFEKMIKRYLRKGYLFISMDNFRDIFFKNNKSEKKYCLITLDDGWRGNLDLLPILEKYKVHVTIFISTEPIKSGNFWSEYIAKERGRKGMIKFKKLPYNIFCKELERSKQKIHLERSALTLDELKEINKSPYVSIHSHTVNHPILTSVPENILDRELKESQLYLEKETNSEVYAFSYPNGSLSNREVIAASKYYKLAFTTDQRHISLDDSPLLLPRVALTGDYYRDLLKIWGIWPFVKKILLFFRLSME